MKKPEHILIIKLSAIGDVIMSLPFLEALRRTYPRARLTWLVEEAAADLVLDHPDLNRVLVSRRKSWIRNLKQGCLRTTLKEGRAFLRELKAEEYDLVVDLQGLLKSGILAFLSGAGRRVGFDRTREYSYLWVNDRLPPYDPDRSAVLRYLDVAAYLGATVEAEPALHYPENPESAAQAEKLLIHTGRPRLVLNPGAKWQTKLWPTDHWRELIGMLTCRYGQVILTGSQDERAENEAISAGRAEVIDLTGLTRLNVLAELFRASDLVICPDTGPMHLAAAVGTPVVALFGPTSRRRTGPLGPGHVLLTSPAACRPCFRKKCPTVHCLVDLKPIDVYRAVAARLEDNRIENTAY